MQARRHEQAVDAELTIHSARDRDRHVVAPVGELDLATAWRLERELKRVEESDASEIVLDLSGLDFIDSVGLQPVLHASARTKAHSKRLSIVPGPDRVQRYFDLTGLTSRLPFVDREKLAHRT